MLIDFTFIHMQTATNVCYQKLYLSFLCIFHTRSAITSQLPSVAK